MHLVTAFATAVHRRPCHGPITCADGRRQERRRAQSARQFRSNTIVYQELRFVGPAAWAFKCSLESWRALGSCVESESAVRAPNSRVSMARTGEWSQSIARIADSHAGGPGMGHGLARGKI